MIKPKKKVECHALCPLKSEWSNAITLKHLQKFDSLCHLQLDLSESGLGNEEFKMFFLKYKVARFSDTLILSYTTC